MYKTLWKTFILARVSSSHIRVFSHFRDTHLWHGFRLQPRAVDLQIKNRFQIFEQWTTWNYTVMDGISTATLTDIGKPHEQSRVGDKKRWSATELNAFWLDSLRVYSSINVHYSTQHRLTLAVNFTTGANVKYFCNFICKLSIIKRYVHYFSCWRFCGRSYAINDFKKVR